MKIGGVAERSHSYFAGENIMSKYNGCAHGMPNATEIRQRVVRKKHPHAHLNAVYDSKGGFKAWRIVSGRLEKAGQHTYVHTIDIVLSGLHDSDDDAWLEAAEKLA